jgi:hypothetical protein
MAYSANTPRYLRAVLRYWVALMTGSSPIAIYTFLVTAFRDTDQVHYSWNHLPQWLVTALAFLGLVLAQYLAWREASKERDAALAELNGERMPPKVTISGPPKVESIELSGKGGRLVTFPRITVENVSSVRQRVSLRLFLDGWDAVYLPPWKPPELFARGGPTELPNEIDLQPGQQATGQIQFRVPFSEPSEKSAFFRLVLARPSVEAVAYEGSTPIELASYLNSLKPPAPPS